MSVPLTVNALAGKLDQVAADQAALKDGQSQQADILTKLETALAEGFTRLAEAQGRQADVLDMHTKSLNELVRGQNAQTRLLRELVELMRGQQNGT